MLIQNYDKFSKRNIKFDKKLYIKKNSYLLNND